MDDVLNPWKTLESAVKYDNPWIRVVEHQVLNAAGQPGIYGTVHYKNAAIGIVPVDAEGCTWLVGQYRYPLKQYSWEVPAGGGRLEIEPLASARRELEEETGLRARQWQQILRIHLSNSIGDEEALCYLAWDLQEGPASPDEDEVLNLRRLPVAEALAMIERGEITDAITVAALMRLRLMALDDRLPDALADVLRRR
jgi:8-oxo-dGTP pyrophosphatase MutT (NUDIX family)